MRTKFESLPNEILLIVLANLSSLELLTSLWWLNKRVDVLVCSILSRVDNRLNSGLAIIEPGLTFNECHSLLFHSISTLHFGLQRIYFDGTNYIASDLSYELLFDNDKNILRFPNLKSIVLTGCFLIKSLIKSLSVLIKHQLNELVLTFDEDVLNPLQKCNVISFTNVHTEKILIKFDELIRQLFSNECRLTSLRLDFASKYNDIDYLQCLKPHDNLSSGSMSVDKYKFRCSTLRRLHIHITHICFCVLENFHIYFEHLIDYVPALEQLFVFSEHSSNIKRRLTADIDTFMQTNDNWVTKAFDELRKDALNTVEYAEFKISGCHRDSNELIRIGKSLVPFLSTYMPHLQTLCLWRPDDFPWTSIRPDYKKRGYSYGGLIRRWNDKLQTSESIKKHAIIFEEDLCELVEQMKDLIFLDIHGEIHEEKVEPYRSMVQALFLYNRSDIGMFRFRLWL
ncbi:unnamed protein product [Rotaria magnacalcarata]